jgi:hypothetical protein
MSHRVAKYCMSRGCISALLIAVTMQPLTIVPASARARDHINYGYCNGSMRLMNDVSRCRKPATDSGQCPPGQIARGGLTWAYHVRCCHEPGKPSACKSPGRFS